MKPISIILTILNQRSYEEIYQDAEDTVSAYVADKTDFLSNLRHVGDYLLVAKNKEIGQEQATKLIVVYALDSKDEDGGSTIVYIPVRYEGLIQLGNGENIITNSFGLLDEVNILDFNPVGHIMNNYLRGCIDLNELLNKEVLIDISTYTYESSSGLKNVAK